MCELFHTALKRKFVIDVHGTPFKEKRGEGLKGEALTSIGLRRDRVRAPDEEIFEIS